MATSSPPPDAGSPGPNFLTPRTKLARMLADIDDEVDNAPTPSPTKRPAAITSDGQLSNVDEFASSPPSAPEQSNDDTSHNTRSSPPEPAEGPADSEDDSDDAVRRPLGRAARRMQGVGGVSNSVSPSVRSSLPKRAPRPVANDSENELYSFTPIKPGRNRQAESPSPAATQEGYGLFVSPSKSNHGNHESEDELPSNPLGSRERLAELIAQKRAERLAKEAEEKERKKQQQNKDASSSAQPSSDLPDEAVEGPNDEPNPDIERIMSDASRPARKASKKALLEMERETQRLSRQQALAHQMKVKKKFTTNGLFARFNMRGPYAVTEGMSEEQQRGTDSTASSAPNSDGIEERPLHPVSTPPSSPPTPFDKQKALVEQGALSKLVPVREDSIASLVQVDNDDEELQEVEDMLKVSQQRNEAMANALEKAPAERKGVKIARLGKQPAKPSTFDSDDDELEIIPRLPSHLRAFERAKGATSIRSADSKAVHNLRHLAHLNYDDSKPKQRKGTKPSISYNALEARLRKQAKDQARRQQLERIDELRAKGIEIQTHEEKEREAEEMEDLLEKARLQAQALRKLERKGANGDEGAMEASEDEDEDFEPDGSDDEEAEGEGTQKQHGLVDDAADETDESEEEVESSEDETARSEDAEEDAEVDADDEQQLDDELVVSADLDAKSVAARPRKARQSRVVADDEDEDELPKTQQAAVSQTPKATPSQPDPFAAFGFGAANGPNALLSPTQAFNATMQTPTQQDTQEDSFDILRQIAPHTGSSLPPTLPKLDSQTQVESQYNDAFPGSQVPESQRVQFNWETQPPETPLPAGKRDPSALSETPTWEPTQDQGLQSPWTVAPKLRRDDTLESLPEHDTQSTVAMRISESPAPSQTTRKNRGKLTRRQAPAIDSSGDEEEITAASVRPEKRNAFREMTRKRKEAMSAAERAEADKELRGMMEEQAEESEDEYAGLGGDDYVAPETEADREIIDSSAVDVDERALAAHFAERERERNEAETSRLYKDLTTGVLRRKMGANAFDLEEDEDELAVRRRRMRQQEEARKRQALLKDDNVKTLAEGRQSKGKDAFLKAIADDDGDDEMVRLSDDDDESAGSGNATQDESQRSQPQTEEQSNAVLQETSGNKRRLPESDESQERPPAKQRRTAPSNSLRRPTSMLEVQESVSFLLDEPQAAALAAPTAMELSDSDYSEQEESDQEADDNDEVLIAAESARQNDGGFAPNPLSTEAKARKDSIDMPPPPPRLPANQRRTPATKPSVIDRLSLKRASSSSDSSSTGNRAAWGSNASNAGAFRPPSLLRRATTNSGTNERGVTTNTTKALSRESSAGVRQGGSKKSSLAYQARVEERKAIVEASARRREENTKRIAALRRQGSGSRAGEWGGTFE